MQSDIAQYYQTSHPGQVQVVGVDEYNGTAAQLRSFKNQTGATYPLLLLGASATGGNFATLYGTFDNYVVVNKQGIVRYHAANIWPHGNRYHLNEIRGCVDSLVSANVEVGDGGRPPRLALTCAPNPFRGETTVELANPARAPEPARVAVHDVRGRVVAIPWVGIAPSGVTRFAWTGTDDRGAPLPPGLYFLATQVGGTRLVRRVVLLP